MPDAPIETDSAWVIIRLKEKKTPTGQEFAQAKLGVAYLAILGGIGTAGVPGGSIPFIVVVLVSLGLNPALIAIILGVDRILDMCRTALNVTGDITAATYIARSEGDPLKGQLRPVKGAH